MKILWVKPDFLHPTSGGSQIRTLETLKRLHQRHEIHFAALDLPQPGAGLRRSFGVLHQSVSGDASGPPDERRSPLGGAYRRLCVRGCLFPCCATARALCCVWWRPSCGGEIRRDRLRLPGIGGQHSPS